MRFFCLAAFLATASAFTSGPAAFTTSVPAVGGRALDNVVAPSQSHANRRATIVMDGKANGTLTLAVTRVRHKEYHISNPLFFIWEGKNQSWYIINRYTT
ncbi:MAG: hypothetical protein ACI8RD_003103 [Bacillariaceae sp.]|jgi:hypothetical protein